MVRLDHVTCLPDDVPEDVRRRYNLFVRMYEKRIVPCLYEIPYYEHGNYNSTTVQLVELNAVANAPLSFSRVFGDFYGAFYIPEDVDLAVFLNDCCVGQFQKLPSPPIEVILEEARQLPFVTNDLEQLLRLAKGPRNGYVHRGDSIICLDGIKYQRWVWAHPVFPSMWCKHIQIKTNSTCHIYVEEFYADICDLDWFFDRSKTIQHVWMTGPPSTWITLVDGDLIKSDDVLLDPFELECVPPPRMTLPKIDVLEREQFFTTITKTSG